MQRNDLGTAVFGGMIALAGVLLLLDRTGALTWPSRWSVWPLLLVGYGLSRMVQSRYEAPRGLFPLALGVWFFGGYAGWFSLRDTWPLLLVAFGLGIAWNAYVGPEPALAAADAVTVEGAPLSGRELRRRRRRNGGPVLPLAFLVLIVVAARADRDRFLFDDDRPDTTNTVAVLGGAKRVVNDEVFTGAQMVSVMGGSDLDLRHTALPPSGEASVDVTVVMGGAILRVPPDWIVDLRAVPVLGGVHDRRRGRSDAAAPPAPGTGSRLVVTGSVVMGDLAIVSGPFDN
jgi:hypothetical protein